LIHISYTLRFTLFPYTTLFRSRLDILYQKGEKKTFILLMMRLWHFFQVLKRQKILRLDMASFVFIYLQKRRIKIKNLFYYYRGVDRKSTRLNSSHVSISYAVFCLKKKIYVD